MTLLATEIHNHDDPQNAFIVFAADRRITLKNGKYGGTRKKIFEIPWLRGAIGYFGVAEAVEHGKRLPMQEWLQGFIRRSVGCTSLKELATALARELNSAVPQLWQRTEVSGFHLAGFTDADLAEFWFVRNIGDDGRPTLGSYQCREEFQRRDVAHLQFGAAMIYRNGDIRAHVAAWKELDASFGSLLQGPGFRRLRKAKDYSEWVRFKMEVVAHFYKKFHPQPVIATPIDVLVIPDRK